MRHPWILGSVLGMSLAWAAGCGGLLGQGEDEAPPPPPPPPPPPAEDAAGAGEAQAGDEKAGDDEQAAAGDEKAGDDEQAAAGDEKAGDGKADEEPEVTEKVVYEYLPIEMDVEATNVSMEKFEKVAKARLTQKAKEAGYTGIKDFRLMRRRCKDRRCTGHAAGKAWRSHTVKTEKSAE